MKDYVVDHFLRLFFRFETIAHDFRRLVIVTVLGDVGAAGGDRLFYSLGHGHRHGRRRHRRHRRHCSRNNRNWNCIHWRIRRRYARQFIHRLSMLKLKTRRCVFIITRAVRVGFFTKANIFPFIYYLGWNPSIQKRRSRRYIGENIWSNSWKSRKSRKSRKVVDWLLVHFFIVQIWFHFNNIGIRQVLGLGFIVTSTFLQNNTLPIRPTTILPNTIV